MTWYYERDSENNEWIKKSDHFFGESTGTEAAPWCGDLDGTVIAVELELAYTNI